MLTSDRNPELNLRRMNEAGLLGRLIPDFGKIVAMMQFSCTTTIRWTST